MKLSVMEIQRFALHDGPGIRTTVFLQGCPLRCPWCANPESQAGGKKLMYLQKRCIGCGRCAAVCPSGCITTEDGRPIFNRSLCIGCGKCVEACPAGALRLSSRDMETSEILSVLLRDRSYYRNTGGGITVSGGEPFLQGRGLKELLALCKAEGLHTAVETTGNTPTENIQACEPLIDLFLFDVKHPDPVRFKEVTGGDHALVLHNLALLPPQKVVLRVPVIPGFNFDEQVLGDLFRLALSYSIRRVDLLPYHTLGRGKYEQLGRAYPYDEAKPLSRKDLESAKAMGEALGLVMG